MLQMLGIPTWFLTLPAADLHWPSSSSCTVWEEIDTKRCRKMSMKERSTYLCQNPITGVHMFQHRLEAFFSEYLLSDTHPLGHITDYVIKLNFK